MFVAKNRGLFADEDEGQRPEAQGREISLVGLGRQYPVENVRVLAFRLGYQYIDQRAGDWGGLVSLLEQPPLEGMPLAAQC